MSCNQAFLRGSARSACDDKISWGLPDIVPEQTTCSLLSHDGCGMCTAPTGTAPFLASALFSLSQACVPCQRIPLYQHDTHVGRRASPRRIGIERMSPDQAFQPFQESQEYHNKPAVFQPVNEAPFGVCLQCQKAEIKS